jgi:predicted ATPase with chaperone activity
LGDDAGLLVEARFRKGMKIYCNAQMTNRTIKKFCEIDEASQKLLNPPTSPKPSNTGHWIEARLHDICEKGLKSVSDHAKTAADCLEDQEPGNVMRAIVEFSTCTQNYWPLITLYFRPTFLKA